MPTVASPLYISGRLMAALKIDGAGTLHLHAEDRDGEGRVVYRYLIEDEQGTQLEEGRDLRSGVGAEVDYTSTMATLLSFLSAAAEAGQDGENSDLFSPAVREWAEQHSDEIAMAECDLEG
jgi:hypothetical protein